MIRPLSSFRPAAWGVVFIIGLLPLLSGCSDESLLESEATNSTFARYVALGNSITAGFQSGGIVDTTQEASYAALLARQMNTPFGVPTLSGPGCPPPYEQFFVNGVPSPQRPNGATSETCGFRSDQVPEQLNNVALPFTTTADATSNESLSDRAGAFSQFFLGGRTQVEAAREIKPTFATVWLGNNDVLGPALAGSGAATPQNTFEQEYTEMLDSLEADGTLEGGVLVGVANVTVIPIFSPGPVYEAIEEAGGRFPPNFEVNANCDVQDPNTGLTPLVPLSYGFGLIGQAQANPGQTVTLDCAASGTGVLTLNEVGSLAQAVQQYNAFIEAQADQRGLAYFNPNDLLLPVYQDDNNTPDNPSDDPIPKFPAVGTDQPFGPFFSLDGVHPSDATHRLVANELVTLLNQPEDQGGYGANLPELDNVPALP